MLWVVLQCIGAVLLGLSLISAGVVGDRQAGSSPPRGEQLSDACRHLLHQSTAQIRRVLDFRLKHNFPTEAQLDEGHARLSPLSIVVIDCTEQRVVVSGTYEFRGNLGVIDVTRRGTTVIQLHLVPQLRQRQVVLEEPEILNLTFDNPAPWFDGKAVENWALALFATPMCAELLNGRPC